MLTIEKCAVCGSNLFEPFLICKDYTVSKENFTISSCKTCGFKFTNPRPEDLVIGNYYKAEEYISHTNTKKGIVNKLYHVVRNYTLKKKLRLISSYVSRGTILDYGCGTGAFLNICKNNGWKTIGMEPDESARKLAISVGLKIVSNKEELVVEVADKVYAITLWHVLEHVTDLEETLGFFKSKLSKEGVLIIAVPNHISFDANYYKEYWAAYDVPRHLYHFEPKTIKELMQKNGFQLAEMLPMKFDSFYVSLLSEKNKTGKTNLIKAFWIGLKSNLRSKNAGEYSSVVYVLKHA